MSTLFAELKRRNVFKVGIAYAIVAWLLIQVASIVVPAYQAPDWIMPILITLIVFGFAIAVFLAWAYELTPEGIKATRSETHDEKTVPVSESAALNETISPRLAILPFENLSPDPDNAFFADGLHEEILSTLTNRTPTLEVISRTTMMSYRRDPKPLAEVARELQASHVLEGSVRREGDQMRLTLQLIDGKTDNHLWAQKYDRTLSAALTLQAEVAEAVADQLAVKLAGGKDVTKPPTTDVIAYDFYLKARIARTEGEYRNAVHYLDQAIAGDPMFARAYAMRALEYAAMVNSTVVVNEDPSERNRQIKQAEESAQQALALDATIGLAHTILADIHVYHWRWQEARMEFEQALKLSPNDPWAALIYAFYLALVGDKEDEVRAWELAQRIVELDPRSSDSFTNRGFIALWLGKTDEAAADIHKALALDPTSFGGVAHAGLGVVEISRGNLEAGLEALRTAEKLRMSEPTPSKVAGFIGYYRVMGCSGDARRLFEMLKDMAEKEYVSATTWFTGYRGIGEIEQALDWLHKAIDTRDVYGELYRMMAKQRFFPDLWDNPRFQEARRKVGFTD